MARQFRKRRCKHCHVFFPPDPRNAWHQEYCSKPECRKASKAESQRRWLQKPENHNHFRGRENVFRVQEWRRANPGYWRRRKTSINRDALQDFLPEKTMEKQPAMRKNALQEVLSAQHVVLLGLIAQFTGTALQDDIVVTARHLRQLGHDILNSSTQSKGGNYDHKVPHLSGPNPSGTQAVQLGGSALGP
jgi:hypothetical protein